MTNERTLPPNLAAFRRKRGQHSGLPIFEWMIGMKLVSTLPPEHPDSHPAGRVVSVTPYAPVLCVETDDGDVIQVDGRFACPDLRDLATVIGLLSLAARAWSGHMLLLKTFDIACDECVVRAVTPAAAWSNGCTGITNTAGAHVPPTHVVFDPDGEVRGQGLSEDAAMADAIQRAYTDVRNELDGCREAIRNYRNARAALGEI